MEKKIKALFLTKYGRLGASSRLRTLQYIDFYEKNDIICSTSALIDNFLLENKYKNKKYSIKNLFLAYIRRLIVMLNKGIYDVIWIEKEALPWCPFFIEYFLLSKVPYILYYDDAIFHNYDEHRSKLVRYIYGDRLDRLMANSSLVTVGNSYLEKRALQSGAKWVERVPTVVDISKYSPLCSLDSAKRVPVIVWIGSPSTVKYLDILKSPLRKLSESFSFKLRIIGASDFKLDGVNIEYVNWTEDSETLLICESDIGVMPLYNTNWELGKCGYKLIQYMACGLPVVASRVGANSDIVCHGENGFLVDSSKEWYEALSFLLTNSDVRSSFGKQGRALIETKYSLQTQAPRLESFFRKVASFNVFNG